MGMMIALTDKATMSNELNSMYIRKPMTLQQLRFFTMYLAKINPDKPKEKVVRFSVKDFANIMNVEVNEGDVKNNVVNLLEHTVWVKSEKYKNGITACHLFRKCEMWNDEETGETMLEFQCSEEIEPYLFKLKKNFTTYEVWNTLRLRSVIHSRMYQLLKQFQKIGERTILITDLKEQLGIEKDAYREYKVFSRDVLKKCQEALKDKTDICFDFKSVGRPAKSIKFTIYKNENYNKQITLYEMGLDAEPSDEIPSLPEESSGQGMSREEVFRQKVNESAFKGEFTDAQVESLLFVGNAVANTQIPDDAFGNLTAANDAKINYYHEKYLYMNAKCVSKEQAPRYTYLYRVLAGERLELEGFMRQKNGKWKAKDYKHGFEQRDYDFEELEQILIANNK